MGLHHKGCLGLLANFFFFLMFRKFFCGCSAQRELLGLVTCGNLCEIIDSLVVITAANGDVAQALSGFCKSTTALKSVVSQLLW